MAGMDPSRLPLEVESTTESGSQSLSSVLSAHVDSSTASTATHEAKVQHSRCLGCCSSQCSHLLQDCTAY